MDCTEIDRLVASCVSPERLLHCRSTAIQARWLLNRYPHRGADPEDGYAVGLWHDMAREWLAADLFRYCTLHGIHMEPEEREHPMLLHGAVAASLLPETVPQASEEWMAAVRWHTLGSRDMGVLGAALYIADYLEPSRTHLTREERERLLESSSLEAICLQVLGRHAAHLGAKSMPVAGTTRSLGEFLRGGGRFCCAER